MKDKYVVRFNRYDSIDYNFHDISRRKSTSHFGEIITVFTGNKNSCIDYIKIKALEVALESIDDICTGEKKEISLNNRDSLSLDIISSNYEKDADVRIYRNDSYTIEKFESWMK